MASLGFEGFEKRLELVFTPPPAIAGHGLRLLPVEAIEEVLAAAQCAVVSAAGNAAMDSYVLSESSLFVYPCRVVLKTCGTTSLLRALPVLLRRAGDLAGGGIALRSCRYSRGDYLFPADAQPFPHADFADEVRFLDDALPVELRRFRRADILSNRWHVYSASSDAASCGAGGEERMTVEVCMTELDRENAAGFYRSEGDGRNGHAIGDEMTAATGLAGGVRSVACAYAFAPCGYSMNALDGDRYATVHVTPEDGHSYASYECAAVSDDDDDVADAIASVSRAVSAFRPGAVSVSLCHTAGDTPSLCAAVADALAPLRLSCQSRAAEDFPGAGTVTYQTFTATTTTCEQ
uniref:S-adenosylmethionine decarboxylase proenzyme n=1 Tax=Leersia perrieri TaxID=77586 RepID=A0A0D9WCL7_9ORYZ